ncbi:MAG: hypothetical protein H2055_10255 [Sphingopyxis sp.]|nr:hypothetical protein [Sphingopyxis sp.]
MGDRPRRLSEAYASRASGPRRQGGRPERRRRKQHRAAERLATALAPIGIAIAALFARAVSHDLGVSGNLGRQSGSFERFKLLDVAPTLLGQHAIIIGGRTVTSAETGAGVFVFTKIRFAPLARGHTSSQADAEQGDETERDRGSAALGEGTV